MQDSQTQPSPAQAAEGETELKVLRRALQLKEQEINERELYYGKLESYLALKLDGKLTATALAKREADLILREDAYQNRHAHLEKEYEAKREKLAADFARLRFELNEEVQTRVERLQTEVRERREALDKAYNARMSDLKEREFKVNTEDAALRERQSNFERLYKEERARLDSEIKAFHETLADQTRARVESSERFLTARHEAMESVWTKEKAVLLQELADWRHKAQEHIPHLLDLERRQTAGEEELRVGRARIERLLESQRADAATEQQLLGELAEWQSKAREALPRILALEKDSAAAEERARRAEEGLEWESARRASFEAREEELDREHRGRVEALEAERRRMADSLTRRREALDGIEGVLLARFQEVEERLRLRDIDWKEREDALRARDRQWHERLAVEQAELNEKIAEVEALRRELSESIRKKQ